MKIRIVITTSNAAFHDGAGAEAARILRELATEIETQEEFSRGMARSLLDVNGNKVGEFKTTGE